MGSNLLEKLIASDEEDRWYIIFNALMSLDDRDLTPIIDYVKQDDQWSDEFRYGLEGLQKFREFYEENQVNYTPDQRAQIAAYDEEWSLSLLDQMHEQKYGAPAPSAPSPEYDIS